MSTGTHADSPLSRKTDSLIRETAHLLFTKPKGPTDALGSHCSAFCRKQLANEAFGLSLLAGFDTGRQTTPTSLIRRITTYEGNYHGTVDFSIQDVFVAHLWR